MFWPKLRPGTAFYLLKIDKWKTIYLYGYFKFLTFFFNLQNILTNTEWYKPTVVYDFSSVVQKSFGPEYFGIAPMLFVHMKTPNTRQYQCVLNKNSLKDYFFNILNLTKSSAILLVLCTLVSSLFEWPCGRSPTVPHYCVSVLPLTRLRDKSTCTHTRLYINIII